MDEDEEFQESKEFARECYEKYRNALRELAKGPGQAQSSKSTGENLK
ncbi:MAG TPA: hypothetical protein VG944_19970 [Fimbriimonas sp.]|nr:hypothetical protein [Fimbriimonas sp.]